MDTISSAPDSRDDTLCREVDDLEKQDNTEWEDDIPDHILINAVHIFEQANATGKFILSV